MIDTIRKMKQELLKANNNLEKMMVLTWYADDFTNY